MQIDNPERGFSYKLEGPLDLRLNPEQGISAAERIKEADYNELVGMFVPFGRVAPELGNKLLNEDINDEEYNEFGSYAVVMVDSELGMVKRVIYGNNFVELQSVNPMYPPKRFVVA